MISSADISRWSQAEHLQSALAVKYDGDIERLIADINKTLNHLLHADLSRASAFVKHTRSCFSHLPAKYRPRQTAMEARFLHWRGDSEKALDKYTSAIETLLSCREFNVAARTRLGQMDVFMYLGRHDEALETGKKALRYFRSAGNDAQAARVMTNIGNVYHRLDKNRLALQYYDKARPAFAESGGFPLALIDYNRANVYTNFNLLDEARRLYESASETYADIGMTLGVGKAQYSLAYLYFLEDKYADCLKTFDKVTEVFDNLGDGKSVALTWLDLAEVHVQLNQYSAALYFSQQSLELLRKYNLRYEQAKAHYFIAEAYRELGDLTGADKSLRVSELLFRKEKNILWQGMTTLARSAILKSLGRYARAVKAAERAVRLFDRSGDTRRVTDAKIARIAIAIGYRNRAAACRNASSLLKQPLLSRQKYRLYNLLGEYYQAVDKPKTALEYYKKAIDIIENIIANLYPDEIRFFFAADKYSCYLQAVNCLLALGKVDQSFVTHSRALAMVNKQYVSERRLRLEIPEAYVKQRDQLRASLKKYSKLSETIRDAGTADIQQSEQRLWYHQRRIRSHVYGQAAFETEKSVREYQRALRPDETLVNFVSRGDSVGLFCVTASTVRFFNCPVKYNDLQALVRELHFLMEKDVYAPSLSVSGGGISQYLSGLSRQLLDPISDLLTDTVIFLLDGIFAQIPFIALSTDDEKPFGESHRVRIIVNPDDISSWQDSDTARVSGRSSVFAPRSNGLPLVETECRHISSLFSNAVPYCAGDADGTSLKRELRASRGFVHIASHASRSSENPLFSKLLLDDGPFYPFDLFGGGIRARLVCLSGCQTAAPGIYYGNSFSLAKAFYQAGARFVLASLWPVSDKISLVFMRRFYDELAKRQDIHAAYRAAVRQAKSVNDNPAFWSSFVLLGL